jgi:fucose permease
MANGINFSGMFPHNLEVAKKLSGSLTAIINTAASVGGIVMPILTGKACEAFGDERGFNIVFQCCAGFNCLAIIVWISVVTDKQLYE